MLPRPMATATGPLSDPFEGQETAAWRGEQRKLLLSERVLHLLATPSKARRSGVRVRLSASLER